MNKIIFAAFLGVAVLLSSCESGKSVYQVWTISSIESTDPIAEKSVTMSFIYSDLKGHSSESGQSYVALPRLVEQKITGDTISRITYSYTDKTITARKYLVRAGADVIVDSLGYDIGGMANRWIFADGTSKPYYITYENGFRSKVANVNMEVKYRNYIQAVDNLSKKILADYHYSGHPNYIGLQQKTVYGDPYYWPTDRFGAQSNNLLSSSVVYEDGKNVTYEFSYEFDLRGFVTMERITRNEVLVAKNKYTYKMGLIEM